MVLHTGFEPIGAWVSISRLYIIQKLNLTRTKLAIEHTHLGDAFSGSGDLQVVH